MIVFMLLACEETKTDTDNPDSTDTSSYHIQTSSLDTMEDCETFTDSDGTYPREAATAYASGLFTVDGSDISGTEKIHLLPTAAWGNEASSQPDWEPCEIIWTVTGTEDPEGVVSVSATYQGGLSTCPEYINEFYDEDFTNTYNIVRNSDGSSIWKYTNGNPIGEGGYTETSLDFLSEPKCENLGNVQTPQ